MARFVLLCSLAVAAALNEAEMAQVEARMRDLIRHEVEHSGTVRDEIRHAVEKSTKIDMKMLHGTAGLTRAGAGAMKVPSHYKTLAPGEKVNHGKARKLQMITYTASMHEDHRTSIDHTWILVAGLICFFLQAGFALLEAGAVRAKNAKNIALKNLMDAAVGGVVYYLFGYALAYGSAGDGTGNPFIGGESGVSWMLNDVAVDGAGGEFYGFFFQYVFAATIATIVSGAVAERIQFKAYILYSIILTGIIYPPCSHWIWSADGFLNKMGVIDYAGGGAVHALSGVAAFCGAGFLGPRIGAFTDGKYTPPKPHNASMMALGVFVLWFGFIPFNAGSGVTMLDWMAGQTARIATMTTLGGCSGACIGLMYGMIVVKHASLEYAINGVLAGMVSVCSPCAVVPIWSVFWIISPIGVLSYFFFMWVNRKCKVDDPLGASALHFGPGIVGMIAVGFFGKEDITNNTYGCGYGEWRGYNMSDPDLCKNYIGLFMGGNGSQLLYQLLACLIYTVYGFITCTLLFGGMKMCKILRVSEADELAGLDATHHGGPAYIFEDEEAPVKKVETAAA